MCDRIDKVLSLVWDCSSLSSSSSSSSLSLLLLYQLRRRRWEWYHRVKKGWGRGLEAGSAVETVGRGGDILETNCERERRGTSCVVDATMDNEGQER